MSANGREPRVLAIDAGGTMTDTFVVDRAGEFVVGKAHAKLYARSARSPQLGYLVTNVIVTGAVAVEKPSLPDEPEAAGGGAPAPKGSRAVWWSDGWQEAPHRIFHLGGAGDG